MEPFTLSTFLFSFIFCTMIAYRAVKKQSLTIDGAIIGWICGICIICSTCYRGLIYFYFYLIGSYCTKYNIYIKSLYDSTVQNQSNRNWLQVMCVSILVTILSLYYGIMYGIDQPIIYNNKTYTQSTSIMCAIIAHHATGLGDTMASELGILVNTGTGSNKQQQQQQQSKPSTFHQLLSSTFLITNVSKVVPPGTNGGITIIGCLWSCCGGMMIGILTIMTDYFLSNSTLVRSMVVQYAIPVILYSTIIGFIGSCIDSILGATCQATYYDPIQKKVYHANNKSIIKNSNNNIKHIVGYDILNNEQVNLVSTIITCILGGWYIGPLIIP